MRRRIIAVIFAGSLAAGVAVPVVATAGASVTASAPHTYFWG
jgi:hypothetical protein